MTTAADIDDYIELLQTTIQTIQKDIPKRKIRSSNQGLSLQTRNRINAKRRMLNLYRKSRNPTLKRQINQLQKQIKNDIITEENNNWDKKIQQVNYTQDTTKSWKAIKYIISGFANQNPITHITDSNGNKIIDKTNMTEAFRNKLSLITKPTHINDLGHTIRIKSFK
jgi:hypothetical protein